MASRLIPKEQLQRQAHIWPVIQAVVSFVLLFCWLILPLAKSQAAPDLQSSNPRDQAQNEARILLDQLTPEERVGQLFLVTFNGTDLGSRSQINDLIANHYVGGVILLAANDNFQSGSQILNQIVILNRQIQLDRFAASQSKPEDAIRGQVITPPFIPLFIGISQEGGGYPHDQILSGLTPLPNQQSIGATWSIDLATQAGNLLGKELSALGFNLLVGPSLDVLESPQLQGTTDLGTRTFGGDPFWVGQLASAYIQGLHKGSRGQMAVIAKHFPGYGGSDRLPEEEVATVRKSLEQLKNFELMPFFTVTGNSNQPDSTADGLLASHIRFQGLQGNIRATTRPVSLDPQAFSLLMSLPPLDNWHKNGGIMVSDNLGSQAVRRFYNLTSQTFDAKRVALNAFLAGNDLLYVADFSSTTDSDSYTGAVRTLDFFAQKYREDTAFAQRVDESVLRILALKCRLYGHFTLNQVLPSSSAIGDVGQSSQVTFNIARAAATLISPSQAELDDTIPDPPNLNDRIVFITDARMAQQCSKCPPQPILDENSLERVVVRRYGPQAGGQVTPNNLASFTLADLKTMLDTGRGNSTIERNLTRANWIVFSMLNASEDVPSYNTLSRFLSERPDLFQQKRLIVFGFDAPYYLDATNISKLTAYYGLYSQVPQFVDIAAYLLFRELRPHGALPVSVPGIGYELSSALTPDPSQVIQLTLDVPSGPLPTATRTAVPTPAIEFHIGDVVPLQTDVIRDHNGNPVPDGTPVDFYFSYGGDKNFTKQSVATSQGIAKTTYSVTAPGTLQIYAESDPAKSDALKYDIPSPGNVPTATATKLPTPTLTATATPTHTPTPTPIPASPVTHKPKMGDWMMAVLVTAGIAWSFYRLAALAGQVRWGVRGAFLALIGGLIAYSYIALQMPGSESLLRASVSRGIFLTTLAGSAIGLLLTWSWRMASTPDSDKNPRN